MSHDYFQNTTCEYFPCHKEMEHDNFSCLFCFCPLYALGEKCAGNYTMTAYGVKDCSACIFPHERSSYTIILDRLREYYGWDKDSQQGSKTS